LNPFGDEEFIHNFSLIIAQFYDEVNQIMTVLFIILPEPEQDWTFQRSGNPRTRMTSQ
jgi:hypothetical protein